MSKIGKTEWIFVYIVMAAVDVAQWVLEFFVIGIAINTVIDPIVGVGLAGYFQLRGVSMLKHPTRLLSLLGVTMLEEVTGGLAPAWVVDVWYIHRTVKNEESSLRSQKKQEEALQNNVRRPLYDSNGVRQPQIESSNEKPRAANIDGIRAPNGGLN